ncbi:protein tesmin/TSO1-like CXC 2 isoform X2 [Durio zibethinus]|uniref:Protein tesmin/TSO1-like CXC 2 isoform X2 n=1 Tax=Durio zibethinus TaxID=66656 RepID=A0A6P5YXS0_DURZI|nr:protein tesmin/TSO1-like CXC 2 isoform X2 [Durio zibethinus]
MDTPDKTQITPTSSLSKFEDSPVFKYIDSLSPIELAKSRQSDNVFSSLAFLSPSSLFPSPQISCHRESRFLVKRHHFSAASNSRVLQSGNESNTSEGGSKAVEQSDLYDENLGFLNNDSSSKGISSDLLDEQLDLVTELPRTLKYDCGSPDGNLEPCDEMFKNTSVEVAGQERSPFQRNRDEWEERQQSFQNERDLRKICRIKWSEESAGGVAIVSDVADMLTMNSSIIHENTDGQDMRTADSGTTSFISTMLQFPLDNANNLENAESGDPSCSCKQSEFGEPVTDQTPGILSTCLLDKLVVSDSGLKKDDKGEKCNQSSHQRSIRRRCLVFEKSPGFGLHLNSLPNIPKGQNPLSKSTLSSMKRGEIPHDKRTVVTENSSETPATFGGNEADDNSPEKKRQKFELDEESAACKRCNCKRSKCLKLYCDCFAAGLYCIEPCSCQDCFNKPVHENVVLETRRQIESRNPLAFAPKVIRSTDRISDSWGETNKTPASARHKRGCNCKRSSCLKKYCECFQAGVGCSPSCRCEGCKNSFGRKDGGDESESDGEDLEACERNASEKKSHDIVINKDEEYPDLSVASSDISRLPFAYSGKLAGSFSHSIRSSPQLCTNQENGSLSDSSLCQPKFDSHLQAIPEDEAPEVLKHKCLPPVQKPTSPNCKRVSPPHRECSSSAAWRSRKLILRSVPLPSFSPP